MKEMTISFEAPYYRFLGHENMGKIECYNHFLNWMKGEFDLYLQENYDGLKIYFPNGWFTIYKDGGDIKPIHVEIEIKTKSLKDGKKIESHIKSVLERFVKYARTTGHLYDSSTSTLLKCGE